MSYHDLNRWSYANVDFAEKRISGSVGCWWWRVRFRFALSISLCLSITRFAVKQLLVSQSLERVGSRADVCWYTLQNCTQELSFFARKLRLFIFSTSWHHDLCVWIFPKAQCPLVDLDLCCCLDASFGALCYGDGSFNLKTSWWCIDCAQHGAWGFQRQLVALCAVVIGRVGGRGRVSVTETADRSRQGGQFL